MIQQWLLKLGNEITNGQVELLRHVCICMTWQGSTLLWLRIFFKEEQGPNEARQWEEQNGNLCLNNSNDFQWKMKKTLAEWVSHHRTQYLSSTVKYLKALLQQAFPQSAQFAIFEIRGPTHLFVF